MVDKLICSANFVLLFSEEKLLATLNTYMLTCYFDCNIQLVTHKKNKIIGFQNELSKLGICGHRNSLGGTAIYWNRNNKW